MAGTGGKREGAGRKPKSEVFSSRIRAAEKRLADKLPDVADALIESALGVWIEEMDDEGERRVYQTAPNFKSAAYVLDRIMGKSREEPEPEPAPPAPPALNLTLLSTEELNALQTLLDKAANGRTDTGGASAAQPQ